MYTLPKSFYCPKLHPSQNRRKVSKSGGAQIKGLLKEQIFLLNMPGKNLGVQVLAPSAPPVPPALQAFSKRYEQLKQFTKSILLHLSLTAHSNMPQKQTNACTVHTCIMKTKPQNCMEKSNSRQRLSKKLSWLLKPGKPKAVKISK